MSISQNQFSKKTKIDSRVLRRLIGQESRLKLEAAVGKISSSRRRWSAAAALVMVDYIKHHESDWLVSYEQKYGPRTTLYLMRLCRRFAARHGFVCKCTTTSKMSADKLMRQVRQNAEAFWEKHSGKDASLVLNCDETGICYVMPPRKILTMKRSPADIDTIEKTRGGLRRC
ncbi:hypothetical protein ACHHYP_20679 [Achlya hypogyna]|uniref:DDE-1 domain-containing protein n=1 Tax=Achlya hypogyna TaxID=1202772 RepID=A0A1V9YF92_ACHHY|nr:hypothetical protein ACHHYP_20679 [Achlya hypogyna]